VKNKINQMFKDKLFLVMLVLGLLTIVAAAGVVTMKKEDGQNPYMNMQDGGNLLAEGQMKDTKDPVAGESNANPAEEPKSTHTEEQMAMGPDNPDTAAAEAAHEAAPGADAAAEYADAGYADAEPAGNGIDAATALVPDFTEASRIAWPVMGNVLLDYSMDTTIYFPTLDQYKCNPGLVIQGEVSQPVCAPANARVLEAGANEEIGNYLKLDLGNEYTAICGQLKEVAVLEGEYLEKGQLLGYVAEPTKYYTIEGSNVFFELQHQNQPVDPLDYLE